MRYWLAIIIISCAALFNAKQVISDSRIRETLARQTEKDISKMIEKSFVAWGAVFPYEAIYPVLDSPEIRNRFRLYSFSVFSLAPFSFSYAQESSGKGFVRSLISDNGVKIVSDNYRTGLLEQYCKEHLKGKMKILSEQKYGRVILRDIQCFTGH